MKYKFLERAIDLHVHVGPDIMPRKFDLPGLFAAEKSKIKGFAVKRHFLPTAGLCNIECNFTIIESITLNNSIGGFNADAVRTCATISQKPIIVWFPTVHAAGFLKDQEYEIPLEWFDQKTNFMPRKASETKGLSIWAEKGKIKKEVVEVLNVIKEFNAILATGHLSWEESFALVEVAKEIGINKIIVTHPICPGINMPVTIQKRIATLGVCIEQCYAMCSIHKIPPKIIAEQIRAIGPARCIISSDVGQVFSSSPSVVLAEFCDLLNREGITVDELETMTVRNPENIVSQ